MLIERAVGVVEVESRIKDYVLLNHFFFNDLFARHIYLLLAVGLRSGRNTDFNLWLNCGEHFLRLLGVLAAKHMFLVNHKHDRYAVIVLCATSDVVERSRVFGFAHHQVLILIDALPVDKENLARLDESVGGVVEFIINNRTQGAVLCEVVLHLEVALFMQFVWGNPNICYFCVWSIGALGQFLIKPHKHIRCHHGFAGAGGRLENEGVAVSTQTEQVDGLVDKLVYGFLLIAYLFHSSPPFSLSKSQRPAVSCCSFSTISSTKSSTRNLGLRFGSTFW